MNIACIEMSRPLKSMILYLRRKEIEHLINNYISMLGYCDTDSTREYWSGRGLMHINTELSEYDSYVRGEL